jgi:uncharacterized protein YdaU (DUF1376 family)
MSLAYFPLFPTDFDADTGHLNFAEDGAYNRLLRLSWRCPEAKMPDDLDWICRKARAVTDADRALIEAVLSEFFTRKGGKVFSARLHKEWVAANAAHQKRVLAGKSGGDAKARKTKENAPSNAKAMPYQPDPEPEPDIREEKEPIGSVIAPPLDDVSEAVRAYNETAAQVGWPTVQKMTDSRRRALRSRIADAGGIDGWRIALGKAAQSDFLCGRSPKAWSGCSFDWLTASKNFIKIMEGNYDNRTSRPSATDNPTLRAIARAASAFEASPVDWPASRSLA